jgi:hypothetical protein
MPAVLHLQCRSIIVGFPSRFYIVICDHTDVVRDQGAVHFVTFTVQQWAGVFTRSIYIDLRLDRL